MLTYDCAVRVDTIRSVDDVIVCATIVWAVSVPLTVKLSAEEAVEANEAFTALVEFTAFSAFVANEALTAFKTYDAVAALVANDELTAFNT